MSLHNANHLDVTPSEKRKLKSLKIRIKDLHLHPVKALRSMLNVPQIRAMELHALSEFQSLPQVGIRFAHDLISMGFYELKQLKNKDGAKLTDKFELQSGVWTDPCVEDQFRLVVHYASNPGVHKNWWEFTPIRKAFREKYGYPATRPQRPWFELPRYQTANQITAKHEATKKDLHRRLKLSVQFMSKHLEQKITLPQLADISHLSQYHFLRCFKSAFELTPFQFLSRLRLKLASQLLRKTKKSIQEIVRSSGFENESAFSRLFKKEFKVTPSTYRTKNKV